MASLSRVPSAKALLFLLLLLLPSILLWQPALADDGLQQDGTDNSVDDSGSGFLAADAPDSSSAANMTFLGWFDQLFSALPPQNQTEFQGILAYQENTTIYDLNQMMGAWAARQNSDFYTVFQAMQQGVDQARALLDQRHTLLMANQTEEVKQADQQIRAIANNQFITIPQQNTQIAQTMASFSPSVQAILAQLAPYPTNGIGGK